jgi:hypothetical protein
VTDVASQILKGLPVVGNGSGSEPPPDEPPLEGWEEPRGREPTGRPSQATELVTIAMARFRLGRATTGEPFATPLDGPHVARMLRGGEDSLRAELSAIYADQKGRAPSQSALADALLVLQGRAQREEPTELALRVADHGGAILVDLGDESGRVVSVSAGGWHVADRGPVLFRRTPLVAAQPPPAPGGDLEELRAMINLADDAWPLLLGWMVAAFMPGIPHPIALLTGEQGAAKSTTARKLVRLLDPSSAELRSSPRDEEQWVVAANGSWVVGIDNISSIPPWLSDAFCRAVTGDGHVRRQLYTDSGLAVLSIRRVLLFTSIDPGALRGDLADRLVPLELEVIGPERRREETEVLRAFDEARPRLLGALLDLVARVLDVWPTVRPERLPRMADFGRVLAAVDTVAGTKALDTYLALGRRLALDLIDADPVAAAVRRFVNGREGAEWTGTPAELLEALTPPEPPKGWPRDATRLSGRLNRAAPALRTAGVGLALRKAHGRRLVELCRGTLEPDRGTLWGTLGEAQRPPEAAGQGEERPLGDAGDAKTALSPSVLFSEREGEEGGDGDSGKSASLASPASPGPDWVRDAPPPDDDLDTWPS